MNKRELLNQLESLIENAEDFIRDPNHGDVWEKDIECCRKCIKLVEEFVDDNGNVIYDRRSFNTEIEANEFKEKCGDRFRNMMKIIYGDKEWWTVEYKF